MSTTTPPPTITTVASFPENFFLENLAARADGSILVTVLNQRQLWHVPAADDGRVVTPSLVHTFDGLAMGIVEAEPDVFYVGTARPSTLERLDLRNWSPGAPVQPTRVVSFDDTVTLNGACLIEPGVIFLADCVEGRILRVDLTANGFEANSSVWLQHHTMTADPSNGLVSALGPQPGINGIRRAGAFVYYTSSAHQLFMRVPIDPTTSSPAGAPEIVASGVEADDFCIDEDAGAAYLTTHTDNRIVRVSTDPGAPNPTRSIVAGDPFDDQLVGPSSAVWARQPGAYGRTAYVTTDGGYTAIEYGRSGTTGGVRPARLLRLSLRA